MEQSKGSKVHYQYNAAGRVSRMWKESQTSISDTLWTLMGEEKYAYDSKSRLVLSQSRYCYSNDTTNCKWYDNTYTFLDGFSPNSVHHRAVGQKPIRPVFVHGKLTLTSHPEAQLELEVVGINGTRRTRAAGRGAAQTIDLTPWKGQPLIWRASIDGKASSGMITIP